jgi:hypothetical protein
MFEPKPVEPPGEITRLSDLPEGHPARLYVQARGFDPDWLTLNFGVGYVGKVSDPRSALMLDRLYIPVTYRNALVGWQCRAIQSASTPKYLNAPNMRKSALLYNYDQAATQPYVIVVEGVPSVWRLGAAAVCLFGKSMSMLQQNLIAKTWRDKPVFLLLDNDAQTETEQAKILLQQQAMHVVPIMLPDSRDPADYSVSDLTDMLLDQASSAGVLEALT